MTRCLRVLAFVAMPLPAFAAEEAAPPAVVTNAAPSACVTRTSRPQGGRVTYFQHCADTPEMVSFRGGSAQIGDGVGRGLQYEQPVHAVTIRPFAIGRYEVTRGEWRACMAAGGCSEPHKPPAADQDGERYPVTAVSWLQAQEYVAWLGQRTGKPYRLPSEAEWEYAARAGQKGSYLWDPTSADEDACQFANILDSRGYALHRELNWWINCDDHYAETAPVGSYKPNAWGVYDMLGNVWEWVEDCWHPSYKAAPADGSAWRDGGNCRKRVNRGGGWGNGSETVRLSTRDADPADGYSDGLGFRVALSITLPRAATAPATLPAPVP